MRTPEIIVCNLGYVTLLQISPSLLVHTINLLLPESCLFNSRQACPVVPLPAKKSSTTLSVLVTARRISTISSSGFGYEKRLSPNISFIAAVPFVVWKSFSVHIVGISPPTVLFSPNTSVGAPGSCPTTSNSPLLIFEITPSGKYCTLYSFGFTLDLFLLTLRYPFSQSFFKRSGISLHTHSAPLLLMGQRAAVPSGASSKSNGKSANSPEYVPSFTRSVKDLPTPTMFIVSLSMNIGYA